MKFSEIFYIFNLFTIIHLFFVNLLVFIIFIYYYFQSLVFMFHFSQVFNSSFLFKSFILLTGFLTISSVNFSNLSVFTQNTGSNISTNSNQNDKTINLLSTSVPQDQKPFIYYFPYQTDGQKTKINVSIISKKGDSFNFIPSESVIFNLSSSDFQNKQGDCRSSKTIRKKLTDRGNLTDNKFNGNFDSKSLTNYSFPFGEISSLGENIGCVGMKIKVMENAQVGDESQIVFTNILDPKLDKNVQKITQIGNLKIIGKSGFGNNSVNNSLKDEIKPPDNCFDLPPSQSNETKSEVMPPCMPSIPGTKTKTRYSGQSFEFKYNESTKKYDTIARQKIDYKNSIDQIGCYNLKELTLNAFGCGSFLEDDIELYVVNYSFLFPISQKSQFQDFYQKQGFTMNPQSQGVQWQVEYYRFKDLNGKFSEWKSYTADIYHKKPSDYNKFVDPKKAEWIKYEINSSSTISKAIEN